MVYTYIQTYFGVEYAYTEASPIPVIWGDGYFYQGTGNTYFALYDRAVRQFAWWALSSGARGLNTGSEGIWQWASGALAQVTGEYWFTSVAGLVRAAVEALPGWHKLIPDTSSLLVTAGRGTHATETTSGGGGSQYGEATTDAYVTASRVPDGSLALIYLSHATTITIDQTKMHVRVRRHLDRPVQRRHHHRNHRCYLQLGVAREQQRRRPRLGPRAAQAVTVR